MDPYQPPDDRDFDNPYAPPQSAFARRGRSRAERRHAVYRRRRVQLELGDFQGRDMGLPVDLLGTWAINWRSAIPLTC